MIFWACGMGRYHDGEGMVRVKRERILLVDDERGFVKGLRTSLEAEGYRVTTAYTGTEAVDTFGAGDFDLVLLDVMLPGLDGLGVLRAIRAASDLPVIMLTAKGEDVDKIIGLELGADDYLAKPFNTRELLARMKAVLRRVSARDHGGADTLVVGDLALDMAGRRVEVGGQEVDLTPKEFDLLATLARSPGRVFTRSQLVEVVWGYEPVGDERVVDVHIRRLREKLEADPASPRLLATKWGVGYFLRSGGGR